MFLEHTEHVGFKRFKLNPISKFIYKPENNLTFVIGTNGSGKTSLLSQWDPSPKASSDYKPGGHCKQIFRDHTGVIYELRSEFDLKGGAKHHFIRDGKPLNNGETGGTAKVQKALVEKYFSFDKELHKVLRGETSFTKMTPKQRQQVITELSNCDLSYAFNVFNEAQSMARNAKGTRRDLTINIEKDKEQLNSFHIEQVQKKQLELKNKLKFLTGQLLDGVKNNVSPDREEHSRLSAELIELTTRFIKADNLIDNMGVESIEELTELKKQSNMTTVKLTSEITFFSHQADDLEKSIKNLVESTELSGDKLDTELERTRNALSELPDNAEEFKGHECTAQELHALEMALVDFEPKYGQLTKMTETSEVVDKTKLWLRNLPNNLKFIDGEVYRIESWLEHISTHDKLNCPKCNHAFLPGVNPEDLPKEKAKLAELKEKRENLVASKDRGEKIVLAFENSVAQRQAITNMFEGLTTLYVVRDGLLSHEFEMGRAVHEVRRYKQRLATWREQQGKREWLQKQLVHYNELKGKTQQGGIEKEIERQKAKLSEILKTISDTQDELLVNRTKLEAMEAVERQFALQEKVVSKAELLGRRVEQLSNELMRYEVNAFIDNLMNETHNELADCQKVINDYTALYTSVKSLERISEEAEQRQQDWELIAEVMSPATGIIAQQLKDHINVLVSHMNQVIDQIWHHNLEIQPCGLTSGKLNYVFPVYIGSDPDLTPDIGMCSKGEREVIDLAFTIVLMLQRGLTEYPLYLDEIASSFDKKHRTQFMAYLNELVSNKKISQIFMINHYVDMYGIVGDHDVVVIDKTNVVVPERYNEHVIIE